MAGHKSKAGCRLRKLKKSHQQHTRRLKRAINRQLVTLDNELFNLLQAQAFYHEALLALIQTGDEPEPWLIGSILTKRWLRESGDSLLRQFGAMRGWLEQPNGS